VKRTRSLALAALLALAGCAAPPAGPGAAPLPCPAEVAGAEAGEWRLVRAEGFTFCVPRGWRPAGAPASADFDAASWRGGGGTVTWGTGAYAPGNRGPVTVEARGGRSGAPGEVRRFAESIGGAPAEMWHDRIGERHFTGAQWARPRPVHLHGEAGDARAAALQLAVYRTVRFPRR
jgi:hypothetical protein